VNYLIRKVVRSRSGGRFTDIEEVTQFKNCGKGIFFPEKVSGRAGLRGEPFESQSETLLSAIEVNAKLPPEVFRLRYPDGIMLTDAVRGTMYKVNSDGQPLTAEKPLGSVPPPVPSQAAGPESGAETSEEPSDISRWILPISVGLIVVAGALAAYRRWKSRGH